MSSNKPLRRIKNCIQDNQFIIGYADYITIYKITETMQLAPIIGSRIDLQCCHIDLC